MAQFVYTMHRVGKVVPPKRHILKNISLSFFPGAKIGVLGLNGAGKSTLLRIMAGIDTDIEGEARPQPGIKIGYLPQEPQLNPEHTVRESVEEAVSEVVNALKGLDEVYAKYAEPDADFDKLAAQQGKYEEIIQAHDGHNLNVQLERAADALRLPVRADFPDIAVHFAFRLDDRAVFLAREPVEAPEGWRYVPSVTYRDAEPRETAFACATGESLQRWYAANRFCGRCGALMTENPAERAMTCPVCHKNVYPRINPAVIVAVLDHGRLLMTKYANRPLIRRYALIAGFCEIGESFEDTVRREVMEEVGLRVKNLRFYKSQPWVLTDSLLLGFFCDVDGDPTPVLRDGELALAEWHTPEDVPADYSRISLTGEMIEQFRLGKL